MRISRASLMVVLALSMSVFNACSSSTASPTLYSPSRTTTNTYSIISGEEALELYGIRRTPAAPTSTVVPTREPWFPIQVWVSASVLPYADPDPIRHLSVYSDEDRELGGMWLGDLSEGDEVTLWIVSKDGKACFIEGVTIQGWPFKGWVLCNPLQFSKPTRVPQEPGTE